MTTASPDAPTLEVRHLYKYYGPAEILHDVSLTARSGQVLAFLGDNGAGKSTLIKILSGVTEPSKGEVLMHGSPVAFKDPSDARRRGIATVFQDLAICNLLSISRNIVLGWEPVKAFGPFRWLDVRKADELAEQALQGIGVQFEHDLSQAAGSLSGGQRQSLAIARAMLFGSSCLILDEPTSALAVRQATKVLEHVRAAADRGQAVILVTHNFAHALSVADEVVVLGRGRVSSNYKKGEVDIERLTQIVARAG